MYKFIFTYLDCYIKGASSILRKFSYVFSQVHILYMPLLCHHCHLNLKLKMAICWFFFYFFYLPLGDAFLVISLDIFSKLPILSLAVSNLIILVLNIFYVCHKKKIYVLALQKTDIFLHLPSNIHLVSLLQGQVIC